MKKVLALDIGGTNTRLALINEKYEIEKCLIKPTPYGDKEKFVENIISLIDEFPMEDVVAFGAGVPGVVDVEKSHIIILPNVGIADIELGKILKEKYNLPLFIRNDAQVACLAEASLGKGVGFNRVFFVTISTGLGGSLCVDKQIQDYLTEVGHTLFPYRNGYQEFEVAAGANIAKLAEINGFTIKCAKEMFAGVENKDENCMKLFEEWFDIIKRYFRLMQDSYLPDIFVVTGGFMKSKHLFFDRLKKELPDLNICECHFSEQAGLIGSAVYAFQNIK